MLSLNLIVFGLFFRSVNITKHLIKTTKTASFFFLLESNSSHPEDKFPYCFGHSYDFLVVTDDCSFIWILKKATPDIISIKQQKTIFECFAFHYF